MGLYSDLILDITAAFDDDLADAVLNITIIEFGDPVYDATTGVNTPVQTSYTTRAVRTTMKTQDIIDEPTLKNGVALLVLDSEKMVTEFKTGMKILIGTDPQAYKVELTNSDPANVSHSLRCSRWS